MNILLFGEYNRAHKFLKEGLETLNHKAIVIGRKDSFKKVDVDISLETTFFNLKITHVIRRVFFRLTTFDIADIEICYKFYKNRKKLRGHDIVQLINEFPLEINPYLERKCLKYLFKHNNKIFLSACSDDCTYVDYLINSDLDYHLMTPYLENNKLKKYYQFNLTFLKKSRKKLSKFIFENIKAVIPADFDYVMAYRENPKVLDLIPHSINISNFEYITPKIDDKIIIFHGINRSNYYRKGNFYFEDALEIIEKKYSNKVEIITVENKPYKEYIESFDKAHILLDQVYSYDQGYNALEAMAKGKVVFTGAEKEWLKHYDIKEDTIVINALPDAKSIANKLEWLILNPEKILELSKNGYKFVAREHDHIKCAQLYLKAWNTNHEVQEA